MEDATLIINGGLFIVTAGATAIAWWRAIAAGRAAEGAKIAETAALRAWSDASAALVRANQVTDVTLRGDYAWSLLNIGTLVLGARVTGASDDAAFKLILDNSTDLAQKSFAVGDASTTEITAWVTRYSRSVEIGNGDVDAWMEATTLMEDRIRLWFRDPARAIEEITRDPRVDMP